MRLMGVHLIPVRADGHVTSIKVPVAGRRKEGSTLMSHALSIKQ